MHWYLHDREPFQQALQHRGLAIAGQLPASLTSTPRAQSMISPLQLSKAPS